MNTNPNCPECHSESTEYIGTRYDSTVIFVCRSCDAVFDEVKEKKISRAYKYEY